MAAAMESDDPWPAEVVRMCRDGDLAALEANFDPPAGTALGPFAARFQARPPSQRSTLIDMMLFLAITAGRLEVFRFFRERCGADPDQHEDDKMSPFLR